MLIANLIQSKLCCLSHLQGICCKFESKSHVSFRGHVLGVVCETNESCEYLELQTVNFTSSGADYLLLPPTELGLWRVFFEPLPNDYANSYTLIEFSLIQRYGND